jgi:sulfite reductase subunit B
MRNEYLPYPAVIVEVRKETPDIKVFKVVFKNKKLLNFFNYKPGQFMEIGLPGIGECPISITSSPSQKGYLEFCIRCVGKVTDAICRLKKGDTLFLRGPYGRPFPTDNLGYKKLYFIAGGIGLAPLRSMINLIFDKRVKFSKVKIFYGARTPKDLSFKEELSKWQKIPKVEVLLTVDRVDSEWSGNIGVVTDLLNKTKLTLYNSLVFVCGPPIMMKFTVAKLLALGFKESKIFISLERQMRCGIGKCGHCNIGDKFVCIDGPVFNYSELSNLKLSEKNIFD